MSGAGFDVREAVLRKLRVDIGLLNRDSPIEEISGIVQRIAASDLDEISVERLLETIKAQTNTKLDPLRKTFAKAKDRLRSDHDDTEVAAFLAEFNAQYAVVNEGGKAWVMSWKYDPVLKRKHLERISFRSFEELYANQKDGNGESIAQKWLEHPSRRQYLGGITFDPSGKAHEGYWNLWQGFAIEPAPGDWSKMEWHIKQVICAGDHDNYEYMIGWLARLVQHPELPAEVAIVMRGGKGVGKGVLGRWTCRLFGQHGLQIINPDHLVGRFNAHLRDCVVLFADEAFYAGDKRNQGILNGLITEPTLLIEAKRVDPIPVLSRLHILMASNSNWVIPASSDERRYLVLDVLGTRQGDRPYFAAIEQEMENGGLAAMLHDLLARDISAFQIRDVPQTAGLRAQKTLSLDSLESWWKAVLERRYLYGYGEPWFAEWHDFYNNRAALRELHTMVRSNAAAQPEHPSRAWNFYDPDLPTFAGKGRAPRWRDRFSSVRP